MVIIGIEANSVTATETSEAFATKEDSCTEEPDIVEANMAGYDPVELGATTLPRGSNSAASTKSFPGELALGRRKAPIENLRMELAAMFALNVNWSSLGLIFWEETKVAAVAGALTVVTSVWTAVRSPVMVTISLHPATMDTTGCKVIVTATPVSEAKYFDNVICKCMNARSKTGNTIQKQDVLTRGLLKPKLCSNKAGNALPLWKYKGNEFPNTSKDTEDVAARADWTLTSFEILQVTASAPTP